MCYIPTIANVIGKDAGGVLKLNSGPELDPQR